MRASPRALSALAIVLLAASPAAKVPRSPVLIRNGPNKVDFAGDGSAGLIMKAHCHIANARDCDVVSFYLGPRHWQIVSVVGGDTDEKQSLTISGTATCVLHDFRLLQGGPTQPATLVTADRELDDHDLDAPKVIVFTYYILVHHDADLMGPVYSFEKSRAEESKKPYCDVEEAFKEELQY